MSPNPTYGVLAGYADPADLLTVVRLARAAGFTRIETYTPCAVDGLTELLLPRPSRLPAVMLGAAVVGAAGGFGLQAYAAWDYPLNSGGRPVFSWPAFVPVTFELGVLTAVLVGIAVFLWRAGLPRYHHPVFSVPEFVRASSDRFFACVRADDPLFSVQAVREVLTAVKPESIEEVLA